MARALFALLTLLSLPLPAAAELVHRRGEGLRQEVMWHQENDWLFSDRGYTNGFRLEWYGGEERGDGVDAASWAFRAAARLTSLALTPLGSEVDRGQWGVGLGQVMYTPGRFWDRRLLQTDQPFAGWLFGSASLRLVGTHDTIELSLLAGPLGAASLAAEAQTLIHLYIVPWAPLPRGWRYQTATGLGVMVHGRWAHSVVAVDGAHWRYFDLRFLVEGRAGTVITSASVGGEVRVGLLGRHQSPGGLDPEVFPTLLGDLGPWGEALLHDFVLYAHFGAQPRVVVHHALIGGTPFANNAHTVAIRRGVVEVSAGLVTQVSIVRLYAGLFMNSPESNTRRDDGQIHWRLGGGFVW